MLDVLIGVTDHWWREVGQANLIANCTSPACDFTNGSVVGSTGSAARLSLVPPGAGFQLCHE